MEYYIVDLEPRLAKSSQSHHTWCLDEQVTRGICVADWMCLRAGHKRNIYSRILGMSDFEQMC
jgi:hypothetical protein